MPLITNIADAVVAELNSLSADSPIEGIATAVRQYRPRKEIKDLKDLAVTVVPKAVAIAGGTRGMQQYDCDIDVAVQQKLPPEAGDNSDAAVDPLMQLVEQVIEFLARRRLAQLPVAVPTRVQNNPIYSVEHLDELRLFTSVITITYRTLR